MRKCYSRNCRIYNFYIDEGQLIVDVLGGQPFALQEISMPVNSGVLDKLNLWLSEDTDLYMYGEEGMRWLAPAPVDTTPPPPQDTDAARYLNGRRQGQFDEHGLVVRRPLPLPHRNKDTP